MCPSWLKNWEAEAIEMPRELGFPLISSNNFTKAFFEELQ